MEHVVFFPGADGAEAFRRAADLEEAVRLVESLRNDQGVGEVSVYALSPVPLAFRTYVHVELPVTESAPSAPPLEAPEGPSFDLPVELSFDEPSIPPPPFEAPESFQLPESFDAAALVPPAPPSDFFEPIDEFEGPLVELPAEPESFAEPEVEEWHHSEADVAWADNEVWSEAEQVSDEVWAEPAPVEYAEVAEPLQESAPIAIPEYHENTEELPPLTLAPGPLLFDGDGAPIASSGSYDLVEEPAAELTDLIPADFTDLIPKDIPHGDLGRHVDEAPAEAPAEALYELSYEASVTEPEVFEEPVAEAPVLEEPVLEEQVAQEQVAEAPSTEDLPPMDVAEIPSDVSSIEAFEANPIPAAREAVEKPAMNPVASEGPRGIGFFGG